MDINSDRVRLVEGFTGCGQRQAMDLLRVLRRLEDGEIDSKYIERVLKWRREIG